MTPTRPIPRPAERRDDDGRAPRLRHAVRAAAFTLTELLVVVLIIVAILLIALPAFASLIYSSESTMAESLLRSAIRAGRDAAIRSGGRNDAAVVFFFEPGGRTTLVPCVKVGEIDDPRFDHDPIFEIFVPSDVLEPVQLPKNWMVRGYAPVNSILQGVYGRWYDNNPAHPRGPGLTTYGMNTQRGDWVFPETGFYSIDVPSVANPPLVAVQDRQTFMIRFEAGTGVVSTSSSQALVLAPRPSTLGRPIAGAPNAWQRPDLATNERRWMERVLTDNLIAPNTRLQLVGVTSNDMVTVRAVPQIALYDETKLAAGIGVPLDRDTGCLYTQNGPPNDRYPIWVTGVTPTLVNNWIEGTGPNPSARIFSIDRHTGVLRKVEVQP